MLQSQHHFDDARSHLSRMSAHCPATIHLVVPSNVHHTVIVNGCHTKPLLLPPFHPTHPSEGTPDLCSMVSYSQYFRRASHKVSHGRNINSKTASLPSSAWLHQRDEPPQQTFKTSSRLPGVHPIPSARQVCFFHTSMIYHIVCTLVCLSEDHFCFNLEYTSLTGNQASIPNC